GLFGLGLLMTISIGYCLIASLVVLPQVFWLVCRRREAKAAASAPEPPEFSRSTTSAFVESPAEEARTRNGRA
ncbi:hypothetical protein, partial [Methylacidimicrobium cyclopophantes]|uniref:hypothetical protein n=1 Tax=Methylacidimicrobium cyclopophantes TaxID=1041766 RepID=UPI001C49A477